MAKNQYGKTRKFDNPYFTTVGVGGRAGWEWRVLKLYKAPASSLADPYARALTAVKSPMTYDLWEYGDGYVKDVPGFADFLRKEMAQPAEPRGPAADEAL